MAQVAVLRWKGRASTAAARSDRGCGPSCNVSTWRRAIVRIMLISGAAAGMSAACRAPLTGIVFALEMSYKDDLAHEALLPSDRVSGCIRTLVSIVGAQPLFGFAGSTSFRASDVCWSALLGAGIGLVATMICCAM